MEKEASPAADEDHRMTDVSVVTNGASGIKMDSSNPTDSDSSSQDDVMLDAEYGELDGAAPRRRGMLPSGCCYDDRMKLHVNADFNTGPHHPEDPRRIEEIFKAFVRSGLVYSGGREALDEVLKRDPLRYMARIPCRRVTREEVCLVHTSTHHDWVVGLQDRSYASLRAQSKAMDQGRQSLYIGNMSALAAQLSAGGAVDSCRQVMEGLLKNAFAIIRPPGHHAEAHCGMGFCLFNNVPIAASVCRKEYPDCQKVLILDWDVHHGNGVQNIFYDTSNVLYISIHVYEDGNFYPGQPEDPSMPDGGIERCGRGEGLGRNVNIGWASQGMGDGEYMAAFQKIVMPIAREFDPDLVIISAGFDAADGDELGGCFVTPPCYAHMTHMLMSLADGKVVVCLEGGYNLKAISDSAVAVAKTLMGEPPPRLEVPKISREAARILANVQAVQAPYWQCMRDGVVKVREEDAQQLTRLNNSIRHAQQYELLDKFGMYPLYLQQAGFFKVLENQVLVTPGIAEARRIVVIIHDPPSVLGEPEPLDHRLEPFNSFVVDPVTSYIEWAAKNNFAVMDVNIPSYVAPVETLPQAIVERDMTTNQSQSLICYIWDNYLQVYESAEEVFFIGVGDAFTVVKHLLLARDCKAKITGVVNFITGSLRPVRNEADPDLAGWYKRNSQVFVSFEHSCWNDPDMARKVRKKRYGNVIKSPARSMAAIMAQHLPEVQDFILSRSGAAPGDTTEEEPGA